MAGNIDLARKIIETIQEQKVLFFAPSFVAASALSLQIPFEADTYEHVMTFYAMTWKLKEARETWAEVIIALLVLCFDHLPSFRRRPRK